MPPDGYPAFLQYLQFVRVRTFLAMHRPARAASVAARNAGNLEIQEVSFEIDRFSPRL